MCAPLLAEPSQELLGKMNSDKFEVRDQAYKDLKKWAIENIKTSPEQLHKAWKESEQPEVKSRCYELMKGLVIQRRFGKGRGFIGIRMQETIVKDPGQKELLSGVHVTLVMPDTPGERAGLKMNDVIVGVDKLDFGVAKHVHRPQAGAGFNLRIDSGTVNRFGDYIQSKQPDDTVTLRILRGAKKLEVKVKLMKRPESADVGVLGGVDRHAEKETFFKTWLKSMAK